STPSRAAKPTQSLSIASPDGPSTARTSCSPQGPPRPNRSAIGATDAPGPPPAAPFPDRSQTRPGPPSAQLAAASGPETVHPDSRSERILSRIRSVPRGYVASYGDIDPDAPRLVGRVLHDAPDDVPWHRIVRADGTIPKGDQQRRLLA